jgi:hypothetical protein
MALRLAQSIRGTLAIRILGVLVLIAVLLMGRFATRQQQTLIIYAVVTCVWLMFFYLGVQALQMRKQVRDQIHNPRLFALAARAQEEWLGLVLACVGALILIFGAFTISGVRQDWSAFGGILVFIAWYLIWRGAYAICLNGTLHYNSLFGGYREVGLEGIRSARLVVGFHPTRPTVRIEIYPAGGEGPIVINRAIFKRPDMESVVKWLGPKIQAEAGAAR